MPEPAPPAVSQPSCFSPNPVHFAQMADQKASTLTSASMVVFTIAVGQLRAGGGMKIPIGILSVLPRGTSGRRTIGPDDNLLFFGAFSQEEFADRMLNGMATEESTFRLNPARHAPG